MMEASALCGLDVEKIIVALEGNTSTHWNNLVWFYVALKWILKLNFTNQGISVSDIESTLQST